MTMVKADTYQSGRDADIMRERTGLELFLSLREPQLANYNTDGRYLSEATNLNCTILSESIRHLMKSDAFEPLRKDESVIHDKDSYSMDGGNKVYNFDSFAYQLLSLLILGSYLILVTFS